MKFREIRLSIDENQNLILNRITDHTGTKYVRQKKQTVTTDQRGVKKGQGKISKRVKG